MLLLLVSLVVSLVQPFDVLLARLTLVLTARLGF
jgi:hypothetical protein